MLDFVTDPFPVLTTERLVLRCIRLSDAPAIFRIRSDEKVMKHIGRPRAEAFEDAVALIERILTDQRENNGINWAITFHNDDTVIGTIGFYRLKKEHFRGEVGYALHSAHWRKGIMREALKAVEQCGFEHFGFHSIEACTDPLNEASNALLLSSGYMREGLFKENYFWNGRFLDSAVYSKLAPPGTALIQPR